MHKFYRFVCVVESNLKSLKFLPVQNGTSFGTGSDHFNLSALLSCMSNLCGNFGALFHKPEQMKQKSDPTQIIPHKHQPMHINFCF